MLKRLSLTLLTIFALIALALIVDEATWAWRVRRTSVDLLAKAKTIEELDQAAGKLGIVISLEDGSWIAIRYRDKHTTVRSVAVARDSGGAWFQSDHHFCGAFMGYKRERELRDELRSMAEPEGTTNLEELPSSPIAKQLDLISAAHDLEHARSLLRKFEFEPFNP